MLARNEERQGVPYDVVYASCGCPAGMGPSGSCKHIGALCYDFSGLCKPGSTQEFLTVVLVMLGQDY